MMKHGYKNRHQTDTIVSKEANEFGNRIDIPTCFLMYPIELMKNLSLYNDVTRQLRLIKSAVIRLFIPQFVQANNN